MADEGRAGRMSQISKLLAMLSSDNESEVLNAVRALRYQLKADGRDFNDLAAVFNANGYAKSTQEVIREEQDRVYWQWEHEREEREGERREAAEAWERKKAAAREQREREKQFPK